MADNKRWFKVWTSILSDPSFDELSNQSAGVWVRLGALLAKHGCNGNITVTKTQFLKRTNLTENDIPVEKQNLAKVNVEISDSCNGNITVTFLKWKHYQEFTSSYERVKRFRDNKMKRVDVTLSCNASKEEEEKKKRREKNIVFIPPSVEEVQSYCKERNNGIDGAYWVDFYQGKGWMVGKNKMKDWKATMRTWERNKKESISDQYADL